MVASEFNCHSFSRFSKWIVEMIEFFFIQIWPDELAVLKRFCPIQNRNSKWIHVNRSIINSLNNCPLLYLSLSLYVWMSLSCLTFKILFTSYAYISLTHKHTHSLSLYMDFLVLGKLNCLWFWYKIAHINRLLLVVACRFNWIRNE